MDELRGDNFMIFFSEAANIMDQRIITFMTCTETANLMDQGVITFIESCTETREQTE